MFLIKFSNIFFGHRILRSSKADSDKSNTCRDRDRQRKCKQYNFFNFPSYFLSEVVLPTTSVAKMQFGKVESFFVEI